MPRKRRPREEDYRDYVERDRDEGWPYADRDARPKSPNSPYGVFADDLDETEDAGVEISDEPIAETSAPDTFSKGVAADIADDALEQRVAEILSADAGLDAANVTIRAAKGVVALNGNVETRAEKALAASLARSADGVVKVIDAIETVAAESHVPPDADT